MQLEEDASPRSSLKLSQLDCSFVECVVRNLLDQLQLIGVIVVDPSTQALELTQSLGEDVTAMIARQKKLEDRFAELIGMQMQLRAMPNKQKYQVNQEEEKVLFLLLEQGRIQGGKSPLTQYIFDLNLAQV
eukprot:TRINITY_DN104380_c0_g1_i1.p1 TRINITY_DN104380_c0_g1~~TRINITY_DN104380_c0_g1_i1.p1  ORF type:complete len:131 (-),score=8.01 TRINITY_DN104380_c0_g1_i1:29-421(-)